MTSLFLFYREKIVLEKLLDLFKAQQGATGLGVNQICQAQGLVPSWLPWKYIVP